MGIKEILFFGQEIAGGITYLDEASSNQKPRKVLVKCYCGKEFITRLINIKNGNTKSCGCLNDSVRKNNSLFRHGLSGHKLFKVLSSIKDRCNNKNNKSFDYYGGRGISVCDDWKNDFMSFYDWAINNGYADGLEIDRIDNNGNYEPLNCRFVARNIQVQNTRLLNSTNKTGYRGVCWVKEKNKFLASIQVNKKHIHLGYSNDAITCALLYNNYVKKHNLHMPLNIIKKDKQCCQ